MWKIIAVDNFGREGPGHDDRLIVLIHDKEWGERICTRLNEKQSPESTYYYRLVDESYVLQEFKP